MGALALIAGATRGSPVLTPAALAAAGGAAGAISVSAGGAEAAAAPEADANGEVVEGPASGGGDAAVAGGPALLEPSEVLAPLLAAACDPSEPVARWGRGPWGAAAAGRPLRTRASTPAPPCAWRCMHLLA
jgi:hypothetical protein